VRHLDNPDLEHIQAMGLNGTTVLDGNRPVVAEADECIPKHSWKPQTVLAHGMKCPVLTEGVVGVFVHVHL
jgi:hypothetical protein